MENETEIWWRHPEIDKIEVSSFGRVRSVKGHYYTNHPDRGGYMRVSFRMNGKKVNKLVHRLVAETFVHNPNSLPMVNHKDCNRSNNNAENLEWCTSKYNRQYQESFGEAAGVPVFAISLSKFKVSYFRSQHEAGRSLGVFQPHINAVIKGKLNQTRGFWFVNADDNAVDLTKQKLREIGKTKLTAADKVSVDFVSQVIAE